MLATALQPDEQDMTKATDKMNASFTADIREQQRGHEIRIRYMCLKIEVMVLRSFPGAQGKQSSRSGTHSHASQDRTEGGVQGSPSRGACGEKTIVED